MKLLLSALALASFTGVASADANFTTGSWVNEDTSPVPLVQVRPKLVRVWEDVDPAAVPAVAPNIIYLNRCKNGCLVRPGGTSSLNDTSSIVNQQGTLSPFSRGDTVWNAVVACMKDVYSPFNTTITDVDPGSTPHFEIMVAGTPNQIGLPSSVGGVSPFSCQTFIPNSLVFDFDVWGNDVEEICSTAAQEIAHSFALDHVTDPSDPLTYFQFNGRRRYKNAQVQCGSDCVQGQGPMGQTCTGSGQQNHACSCTGSQTQNSFTTIQALFGGGTPTPPTVTIVQPKNGDNVKPGFPIGVTVQDDQGTGMVEFRVDNVLLATQSVGPFAANAPTTLTDGTHTVKVTGYDVYGAMSEKSVQVVIGKPCGKPSDCPKDTDTCIGGRCVPGPGVQGGLGSDCTQGSDCASGQCAQDNSGAHHCVEVCSAGQCPDGFGCLVSGAGPDGVCWPGYDDGTGGCSGGGAGGAGGMLIGLAALIVARRRR